MPATKALIMFRAKAQRSKGAKVKIANYLAFAWLFACSKAISFMAW